MSIEVVVMEREARMYTDALAPAFPDVVFHAALTEAESLPACANADVIIGLGPYITPRMAAAGTRLRWIQALTTGTDTVEALPLAPEVIITSGRGIHGPQMAELAFLTMMSLSRDFPAMLTNQRARKWERWPQRLLLGKTAVLVGVGVISEEIASRCKAFGMHVIGVSSARESAPGFDEIMPRARLREAAARAHFLLVLVPLTPETTGMIDAGVLAAMRPDGVLVNMARGPVVDEAALVEALRSEPDRWRRARRVRGRTPAARISALGHAERDRDAACRRHGGRVRATDPAAAETQPGGLHRRQDGRHAQRRATRE